MSKQTNIQWAHSSLNLMMGCDGCELWNAKANRFICYAGNQTARYAGMQGWPKSFEEPKLFIERLSPALRWGAPTDLENEKKPWMAGMPRLIFLNDMGDTFTESLPLGWMRPIMPLLAASQHHFLILTKRPKRMAEFSQETPFPPNVWPGTTVTSAKTIRRVELLSQVQGGGPKFVSFEPVWDDIRWQDVPMIREMQWIIIGGESADTKESATLTRLQAIDNAILTCRHLGLRVFVKQLGSNVEGMTLEHHHGGDWDEWPAHLRVREMPALTHQSRLF